MGQRRELTGRFRSNLSRPTQPAKGARLKSNSERGRNPTEEAKPRRGNRRGFAFSFRRRGEGSRSRSLPDHLDQDALGTVAVELSVEDLLPRTEVELAVGDGDHRFAPH